MLVFLVVDIAGHESHGGVHVCSKCGWPFPNPHPSARHRRAHKRICGTIDGYKLVGLQENTQSDDEHSDDDRKTPSELIKFSALHNLPCLVAVKIFGKILKFWNLGFVYALRQVFRTMLSS